MTSQQERLCFWLKEYGNIDPLTAWRELGIYRLSAVIFDLRKSGMEIVTKKCEVKNRWGESCKVAEYQLLS